MKSSLLFMTTSFLLLTCFWACQEETPQQSASASTEGTSATSQDTLAFLQDTLASLQDTLISSQGTLASWDKDHASAECSVPVLSRGEPFFMPNGDTIVIPEGDTLTYRIADSCALNSIGHYQAYIDSVKSLISKEPIHANSGILGHGAAVDMDELLEILIRSKLYGNDKLYVYMGVVNDSTELIFAMRPDSVSPYQYFDFTLPCPTGCPELTELAASSLE